MAWACAECPAATTSIQAVPRLSGGTTSRRSATSPFLPLWLRIHVLCQRPPLLHHRRGQVLRVQHHYQAVALQRAPAEDVNIPVAEVKHAHPDQAQGQNFRWPVPRMNHPGTTWQGSQAGRLQASGLSGHRAWWSSRPAGTRSAGREGPGGVNSWRFWRCLANLCCGGGLMQVLTMTDLVPALTTRPPRPGSDEGWAACITAKTAAEADLRARDLDWTIVRPGGLIDAPATGRIRLAPPLVPPRALSPAPTSPRS